MFAQCDTKEGFEMLANKALLGPDQVVRGFRVMASIGAPRRPVGGGRHLR
jgi:hypothetical protein